MASMVSMGISVISLVERHGRIIAGERAVAPDIGAEIWIRVEFERSDQEPWQKARKRVRFVFGFLVIDTSIPQTSRKRDSAAIA